MTTLHWLVYISANLIPQVRLKQEIARIVDRSSAGNGARGITGALIATPTHLAQYIEGPEDAVADLLGRIARDERHASLQVIDRGTRADRLFPDWHMAYVGGSVFVRGRLVEVLESALHGPFNQARQLIDLMLEFAPRPR